MIQSNNQLDNLPNEEREVILAKMVESPSIISSEYGFDLSLSGQHSVLLTEYLESIDDPIEREQIIRSLIDVKRSPIQYDTAGDATSEFVLNAAVVVNVAAYVNLVVAVNVVAQAVAAIQLGVSVVGPEEAMAKVRNPGLLISLDDSFVNSALCEELSTRRLSLARQKALIKHAITSFGKLKKGLQTIQYKYKGSELRLEIVNEKNQISVIEGSIH